MSLKIGFFGSAPFVTNFIKSIFTSRHRIVFIVSAPDMPRGRGKSIVQTVVSALSTELGIKSLQPESIKTPEFTEEIRGYCADLFLVIAYGKKLPVNILDIPAMGSFNIHFSLLPRWRGAAPVNHCIMNGDKETGITLIKMDEGIDTGDIAFQKKIGIGEADTTADIFNKMISEGGDFLIESIDKIEKGEVEYKKQDDNLASYAGILTKEDGLIDWTKNARDVHNFIRGIQPWPGAYTFLDGKRLKIFKSEIVGNTGAPGCVIGQDAAGIVIGTGSGSIRILEIQEEGKNRMMALEYIRGKGLLNGKCFDAGLLTDNIV